RREAGAFDFIRSFPAMMILGSYILAYTLRIYIMNYFKNTRAAGVKQDNKGYFTWEQISATTTLFIVGMLLFFAPELFNWNPPQIEIFRNSIIFPRPKWDWAFWSGIAYGFVAFVSVFIFLFKGRTATFAGLVNRLTSLVAGTCATLIFALGFGGKIPSQSEWTSLIFIVVAVGFLSRGERKRAAELIRLREIEVEPAPSTK
ncbi:MAG: hypothetical protein V1798_06740, partial [Pseudomonadota bacterium]